MQRTATGLKKHYPEPIEARPAHAVERLGASANAGRSYERYVVLARAAALTGDTIETENLHQHAEHYFS